LKEEEKKKKPPWDTEHHIKRSMANHEVQVYVREYFDKPLLKEGEGIPKVRELYSMNDRQCGWHDAPSAESGFRRTYLDWVTAHPECQQLPSYWRKAALKKSKSVPSAGGITIKGVSKPPSEQSMLERLAQMPAHQSAEFWRMYAQQGKKAPPPDADNAQKGQGSLPQMPVTGTATLGFSLDDEPELAKGERKEWNARWNITHSKDNERMCKGHQQYFTSAQFLSGQEHGHPGGLLGLSSMRWRQVASTVSNFPVGAEGRTSTGRFRLLV
jgi:hypothetical protein